MHNLKIVITEERTDKDDACRFNIYNSITEEIKSSLTKEELLGYVASLLYAGKSLFGDE